MTLIDLGRLLKRYWYIVVILPVVCALACGGFLLARGQGAAYSATSYVVAGSQLAGVNGLASSLAREYVDGHSGISVTAKADTASMTVSLTATGPDGDACIDAANEVADATVEEASSVYGESFTARVEPAPSASRASGSSPWTYVAVAIIAGLFAAVVVVIAIDAVKRPVKGSADLNGSSGLPVLEQLPAKSGEHLLANIRFACGDEQPRTVCIAPVGSPVSSVAVSQLLAQACAEEARTAPSGRIRPDVTALAPLSQGMSSAYAARRADAVVLTAVQWVDSRKDVESTTAELVLANAKVVGCVLVKGSGHVSGKDHA